ncbi:ABC transporter substrate-binding protein [Brasilonema sp. UFV-L1]|uniref:ABC transporter substrate-binding protein n=1 Tax=Brasilonema sp. UFV-L1 TaxID=2234130 RepID=UPI001B7CDF5C|nr:ABC transporter substrate-binding protein [Brasilonema sp. UFV-L1]
MLVIFEIGNGSFEQGFHVTLRIGEDDQPHFAEISGCLPPAPEIPQRYQDWQSSYLQLEKIYRIIVPQQQITNFSTTVECQNAAVALRSSLNHWLNQPPLQHLERQLLQNVGKSETVRFILKTQDPLIRRLPWHLWDLFENCYPQAEIALSAEHEPSSKSLKNPVKILAILGNSEGINVKPDMDALKELPGAKVEPLIEASREQLIDKLWSQPWDILCFAGHSCSQDGDSQGVLQINPNESLSLDRLRRTLRFAVQKGLKLAIFNSCDGLGLAINLADLRIPYVIVMREPVPDIVAQKFLRYFLTAFTSGESLYTSVRQARERLEEELEEQYPCASWLPIIFQNPAAAELKWPQQLPWKKIGLFAAGVLAVIGISGIVWRVIDEMSFSNRISLGEKILLESVKTPEKEAGVRAFWFKDYKTAVSKFEKSRQQNPSDPETLIYLNNAKIGEKNALTIAVGVPIGTNPDVAQEILRGVAQAQDEVNRQNGIDGKPLKVEIANDDNDEAIARRIAHKFVDNQDILVVVGHNSSNASVKAAEVYQANKLVMISPTSSSRNLTEQNNRQTNYIFRTVVNSTIVANALAPKVKMVSKTKIVYCRDSKAIDQSFKNDFDAALGDKLIEINCDLADPQLKPEEVIQKAINVGADSLLLDPFVDRVDKAIAVAKAAKSNKEKQLTLFGNPSMQTQQTLLNGNGAAVNGMIIPVPWHPAASVNQEFGQNASKLWGDRNKIGWRAATSYDATQVIIKGLRKENTRGGIQKALSNSFSMDGATGKIQFSLSGDRLGTPVLIQVKRDPKASTGYNFVSLDEISSRISLGEKFLVTTQPNRVKQEGVKAFAQQDYNSAFQFFQASLQVTPNDPEARIYMNNAQAALGRKTFTIAVSVPIVTNLNVAQEILRGVAQAQHKINSRGGIQGHLLQVVIASDDNNPEIAERLAAFFVKNTHILAVVAHNASEASVAAAPVYNDEGLVMISATSFSTKLSNAGKYIFRVAPSIRFIADSLSGYAVRTAHKRNLAICVDEKAIDNQSFRDELQSALYNNGGNFVKINCDLSAPDFNPSQIMADAIRQKADGLVLAPHVDRINKALDLARANQRRLVLFASPTLYTSETFNSGRADVNGMVLAVPWHPTAISDNSFGQNAHKLWGGAVNWRTVMAYDAVIAIATGLEKSSTRDGLQQVLRSQSFFANGATGKIEFLPSGDSLAAALRADRNGKPKLVQIQPSKKSPTGYDFIPLNP